MGLPASLVDFTSPIVEKALETGARGKTVTTTDYGVIGDAMFKKASLDLGIANLQADMGMKAAQITSGIELQKAGMNFDMAKANMEMRLKNHDLLMQLRENDVGFFEGLLNVAAGAVGAASIAVTAGASTPLVIGAAAGGGLLTAGAQAQGGRQGARNALGAIGTISQGAQIIKGMSQEQQGKDAWGAWTERAQFLSNLINQPGTPADKRQQAIRDLDTHMGNGFGVLTNDMGMNPQAAQEAIQGVRKVYMGSGGMADPDRAKDFHLNTMQQAVEAQADPRFDTPAEARQAKKEFLAKAATNYAMAYGGKEMPASIGEALLESSGINKRPGIMEINKPKDGMQARRQVAPNPPEQARPQDLAEQPQKIKSATKGRPIRQAPPAYDSSRVQEAPGRVWHPPMVQGPGLSMDDGQPPAAAEQQLAKQGAETVKILNKAEASEGGQPQDDKVDSIGERILHGGKVGGIGIPGLLSNKGAVQDENAEHGGADAPGQGKQIVSEVDKLTPAQAVGKDLPAGAPEKDLKSLVHKKAAGIESYVNKKLEGTSGKTAGPQGNLKAVRDAATDLKRMDEIMDSLPQGPVKRFLADAANEGKSAQALEWLAFAAGTGGASMLAKGAAKGAVAMADKGGKAAEVTFDAAMKAADKLGVGSAVEKLATRVGIGAGAKEGVGLAAKGAKVFLSDKEKDAITQLRQVSADLRSELIKSGMIHAGDTKLENEQEYGKLLPQISDSPRTRYRKMLSLLNNLEGSADTSAELFGGGEGVGKSAAGASDRRKAVKEDLDIEFKRNRNAMQRQKMQSSLADEAEKMKKKRTWLDID